MNQILTAIPGRNPMQAGDVAIDISCAADEGFTSGLAGQFEDFIFAGKLSFSGFADRD